MLFHHLFKAGQVSPVTEKIISTNKEAPYSPLKCHPRNSAAFYSSFAACCGRTSKFLVLSEVLLFLSTQEPELVYMMSKLCDWGASSASTAAKKHNTHTFVSAHREGATEYMSQYTPASTVVQIGS